MGKHKSDVLAKLINGSDPAYQKQLSEMLAQAVAEKVREALADEQGAILQPFFQPNVISQEIKRQQAVWERKKWVRYFEKWGCVDCHGKKSVHMGCGFCVRCYSRMLRRLDDILRELAPIPEAHPQGLIDNVRIAQDALRPSIEILTKRRLRVRFEDDEQ